MGCICILNNEDPLPQEQSVFGKELSLFDAMHAIVAFIGFPGHFISACMHELVCSGLATGGTEMRSDAMSWNDGEESGVHIRYAQPDSRFISGVSSTVRCVGICRGPKRHNNAQFAPCTI